MSRGWILIVGYGSIGRRHFENLRAIGREDVRLLRTCSGRPGAFASPTDVEVYTELDAALADAPAVVVVANPTSLHVPVARAALEAGANVLLEKPVCADLAEARSLLADSRKAAGMCGMGYCFRYHPLYRKLRETIANGRIGRPFHAHAWQASYLPAWHPWEDYHNSYAARADLGGGVVRTLDHDLDMIRWVLGQPTEVVAVCGPLSGIEVEVEDTADMIFRFSERLQAHVHVSFARQDHTRGMWVAGEAGSVNLDWNAGSLTIFQGAEPAETVTLPADFDLNTIYVEMLRDALDGFAASPPRAAAPLADGVAALEMGVKALESNAAGRAMELKGAE